MAVNGSQILAQALQRQGVDNFFYIMGAPMLEVQRLCLDAGMRGIDVRHEQAAAMMAVAYARVTGRPTVCMGASGPGTINLTTGLAHALVDCAPVVALGGGSGLNMLGRGDFQEIDQVAVMKPVTKWAERVYDPKRIPEYLDMAFRIAQAGKPGPVFLDLPGDMLNTSVDMAPEMRAAAVRPRAAGDSAAIAEAIRLLSQAKRPVILSGSGVLWSGASAELTALVDRFGIPFYTTPQGRGVVPEDHSHFYAAARSTALAETDCVLVVGTRLNYVFGFLEAPRFSAKAKVIRIDADPNELASSRPVDLAILGDAKTVLGQLLDAGKSRIDSGAFAAWRGTLAGKNTASLAKAEERLSTNQTPIHPLRLCKEVRDFIRRDAILVVDGQEILNYARQSIPTYVPGHRLNSGTFGTMGVGLPFALGAKVAKPGAQVVCLHGDGSFGLNAMELDTAIRHKIPVLVVISLNGGWTADPTREKPGRDLGYTRFDKMAEALGCFGTFVEKPEDIRPALERAQKAVDAGQTAVVNVVTDWQARATTAKFTFYST